jgi:hypothetical protein
MTTRLAPETRLLRSITERALQDKVIDYARLCGWLVCHFHDSRKEVILPSGRSVLVGDEDAAGFPDTVLVRGTDLIFAEIKRETGRVEPEQQLWLDRLARVPGVSVCVWRPSDWPTIEARLARVA